MKDTTFVKAYCSKINRYFALEVKQYGSTWKVVDMTLPKDDEAAVLTSEVKQDYFETNTNLIACPKCGSRKVGGCSCTKRNTSCSPSMGYKFECIYCNELVIDYSRPSREAIEKFKGSDSIKLAQGKEVKIVTFSNVEWIKFDNIKNHVPGRPIYDEPLVHVIANEENIEFHGYNISQMDEGVFYEIGSKDDFDIECSVDTSTIRPHPGGYLYIDFGEIKANINLYGGSFTLGGKQVATVGSKFKMRLCRENGVYSVFINDKMEGSSSTQGIKAIKIIFGFAHESHHCYELSHAYLRGIVMTHGIDRQ